MFSRSILLLVLLCGGCAQRAADSLDGASLRSTTQSSDERCALVVRRLRERGWNAVASAPFVVCGFERRSVLEARIRLARRVFDCVPTLFRRHPQRPIILQIHSGGDEWEAQAKRAGVGKLAVGVYERGRRTAHLRSDTHAGNGLFRHEMSHAYVHADYPSCPTWLDEALALFFESARVVDGCVRPGAPVVRAGKGSLSWSDLVSWSGDESACQRSAQKLVGLIGARGGDLFALYRRARDGGRDPETELLAQLRVSSRAEAARLFAAFSEKPGTPISEP